MDFEKWWKESGSLMAEAGCSPEVVARATWEAATGYANKEQARLDDDEIVSRAEVILVERNNREVAQWCGVPGSAIGGAIGSIFDGCSMGEAFDHDDETQWNEAVAMYNAWSKKWDEVLDSIVADGAWDETDRTMREYRYAESKRHNEAEMKRLGIGRIH